MGVPPIIQVMDYHCSIESHALWDPIHLNPQDAQLNMNILGFHGIYDGL